MSDLEIEAILPPNHRYMNAKQFGATIPFPQHPLVPYHHGVRIDTIKLFLVMDVFVQPFKAPSMRWYPRGFSTNLHRYFEASEPIITTGHGKAKGAAKRTLKRKMADSDSRKGKQRKMSDY